MSARDVVDLDEGGASKGWNKIKNNPFVAVGLLGFVGTLGVGAYRFRHGSKQMNIPLFLVQLRVAAQGAVVGCIFVGMMYQLSQRYYFKKPSE